MRARPNPFAETGAASSVKRLLKDYDSTIEGIEDQRTLTPFQRQVIDAAETWEAEKQQERQEELRQQQQSGEGRPRNSRATASSIPNSDDGDAETVRYINENEYPDHPVHQD